jgi:hypothetical protein
MKIGLPDVQERRFRRFLTKKDESQYGVLPELLSHENTLFADLGAFAQWVKDVVNALPKV